MLTFEDRWSMCPSKIDGRCEIRLPYLLKTLILYISCMRITPRVCTSVLSLYLEINFYSIIIMVGFRVHGHIYILYLCKTAQHEAHALIWNNN